MFSMPNYQHIDLHAIVRITMDRYGFQSQFPKTVIQEVGAFNEELVLKDQKNVVKDNKGCCPRIK